MTLSVTKTIQIARPAADVFDFLADPATMPSWAIHNVKSIRPLGNGRWEMDTPRGKGGLVPHYEKSSGILDHEFIDAGEGHWAVSARVVPVSGAESVYMITLNQPEAMPEDAFEQGMILMDDELRALKDCVEGRR
jgi:hypothetical protein